MKITHLMAGAASVALLLAPLAHAQTYDPGSVLTGLKVNPIERHQAFIPVQPKAGDYARYDSDLDSLNRAQAYIQAVILVDANGVPITSFGGGGGGGGAGTEFAEDSPHTSGALGTLGLGVRMDTAASTAGTTGDYVPSIYDASGRMWVNNSGVTQPVSDAGGSLTVDGSVSITGTPTVNLGTLNGAALASNQTNVQAVVGAVTAERAVIYDAAGSLVDWTAPVPVNDNGGSLTIDGTVSLGGTLPAFGSTPTVNVGTVAISAAAGSPSASVLSIQGLASMTPVQIAGATSTLPVSITNTLPVQLFGSSSQALAAGSTNVSLNPQTANSALHVNAWGRLWNGTQGELTRSIVAVDGTGLGVTSTATAPCSAATCGLTPTVSTAVESSRVAKASAGNLYSASVTAGASAGFLLVFNATSAPADGAVTPQQCVPIPALGQVTWDATTAGIPERFTTGITLVFSTTGCFTKTASATAFMRAKVQ